MKVNGEDVSHVTQEFAAALLKVSQTVCDESVVLTKYNTV